MPHQCTDCGRRFDDGSKEMLSGCPNCGGNKFQFLPSSASEAEAPPQTPETTPSSRRDSSVAQTVGNAATAVRDLVGRSSGRESRATSDSLSSATMDAPAPSSPETAGSESRSDRSETQTGRTTTSRTDVETTSQTDVEDAAQASARTELVSPDELPSASETARGWEQTPSGSRSRTEDIDSTADDDTTAATERPDLSELRAELNQQFESIKVVKPGEYELNLMELFDRQEYIVALQEDGKYTVQVPEHWQD